ncbi:MAG: transcription elongation factor GreA [Patescibacteria group bacterium]
MSKSHDEFSDEYISQEGLNALKHELEELKGPRRIEIANKLEFAKGLGDLSENAEYAQAKEEHMVNEAQIQRLEDYMSRAKIIEKRAGRDTVGLGTILTVSSDDGTEVTYTIVGTQEVNVSEGKISHESPFGRAFLGHKVSEKVIVKGPKGDRAYRITEIK